MQIMDEKEFNKKYPNWLNTDAKGKYINLPKEKLILISDTVPAGKTLYIAIDNSDNCCWTEDFKTLVEAQAYLNGNDISEKIMILYDKYFRIGDFENFRKELFILINNYVFGG